MVSAQNSADSLWHGTPLITLHGKKDAFYITLSCSSASDMTAVERDFFWSTVSSFGCMLFLLAPYRPQAGLNVIDSLSP